MIRRGTLCKHLIAPALGLEHLRVCGVAGRGQQRRLGHERVEAAHDRARADEALAVEAQAGHGGAAVAQRADQHLAHRQQVDAVVVDRLQPQRGFDGGARMRAGQRIELGGHRRLLLSSRSRKASRLGWHDEHRRARNSSPAEHNGRRCCSSSTSETRRPTSERSAARSCSSTGALRPSASPPPTSWAPRCATCSELRGCSFEDLEASIVSSTVPQLEPEWTAMASRYLGHEMLVVGPGTKTGMAIRYDNPREIGADRLVNAVAHPRALRRPGGVRGLRHRDDLRRRLARGRVPRRLADDRASRSRSRRSPSAARGCRRSTSRRRRA